MNVIVLNENDEEKSVTCTLDEKTSTETVTQ